MVRVHTVSLVVIAKLFIVRGIVESVQAYHGSDANQIVLTVPLHFGDKERGEMRYFTVFNLLFFTFFIIIISQHVSFQLVLAV